MRLTDGSRRAAAEHSKSTFGEKQERTGEHDATRVSAIEPHATNAAEHRSEHGKHDQDLQRWVIGQERLISNESGGPTLRHNGVLPRPCR